MAKCRALMGVAAKGLKLNTPRQWPAMTVTSLPFLDVTFYKNTASDYMQS